MFPRTAFFALLLTLFVSCRAFVPKAFSTSVTHVARTPNVINMACRFNAKKEKRKRNAEKMRKFKKAPVGGFRKNKGSAVKSGAKAVKRAAAKERENEFVASLFMFTNEEAA